MSERSRLHRAAIHYARHGWPVFPLKPGGKAPLTVHGLHDATTLEDTIDRWWTTQPDANIGVRTGITFDVVDVDDDNAFALLDTEVPGWRSDVVSVTAHGEHHLYAPADGRTNRAKVRGVGLDVRAAGGYICAPPSVHESGHRYRWASNEVWRPLPVMPADLEALLWPAPKLRPVIVRPIAGSGWNPTGLLRTMALAVEGSRNNTLFWCVSRVRADLHDGRVSGSAAVDAIARLNAIARARGLDDREVDLTTRSAMKGTP